MRAATCRSTTDAWRRRLTRVVFVAAILLAAAQLAWSVVVALRPGEVEYGESLIYDQAARLLRGEPLYQDFSHPPYTVTAYTPVYYLLVAALRAVFGPGFLPGRVLSLVSASIATGIVGWQAARLAGAFQPGALAALLFFGLGFGGGSGPLGSLAIQLVNLASGGVLPDPSAPWSALLKEDLLGVCFSFSAVACLAHQQSIRWSIVAGLLAGLALLTKQTFFAATVAGAIWLWQSHRRAAVAFVCADVLLVATVAVGLELTSGAFFENAVLANANPTSLIALTENLKVLGLFQGALVLAAGVFLWRTPLLKPRRTRLRLLAL